MQENPAWSKHAGGGRIQLMNGTYMLTTIIINLCWCDMYSAKIVPIMLG